MEWSKRTDVYYEYLNDIMNFYDRIIGLAFSIFLQLRYASLFLPKTGILYCIAKKQKSDTLNILSILLWVMCGDGESGKKCGSNIS